MFACTWQVRALFGLSLLCGVCLSHTVNATSPTPIIGEVAWAGSSLSTADEWLELWNTGDTHLVLQGYVLEGASPKPLIFEAKDTIPPHGAFLIANYDSTNSKTVLNIAPNFVTSSISLSNDKLTLILKDPNGTIISQAGDGTKPFAGSSAPKASMIHQADDSWQSASLVQNMKEGISDQGSPGICDQCSLESSLSAPIETLEPQATSSEITLEPSSESTSTLPIIETTSAPPLLPTASTETTSTVEIAEEDSSSSTNIITTVEERTTSTETIIVTSTESVPEAPHPQITPEPTTTNSIPTSIPVANPTPITLITLQPRLFQAMSNPNEGPEWVELDQVRDTDLPYLQNWSLEDAVGPIFRFTSSTLTQVTSTYAGLRITLSKSYLNNSGDQIKLKDQHGLLMDQITLPSRTKDQVWNRDEALAIPTATTLIETANTASEEPPEASTSILIVQGIPIPASTNTIQTITSPQPPKETTVKTMTSTKAATKPKTSKPTEPKTNTNTSKTASKTPAKPKTPKKATALKPTKTDPPIQNITFDMLEHIELKTRVRLLGTVASLPSQVGQNYFILQNPDGRGLLVHSNQTQPVPSLGTQISITGTLTLTSSNSLYLNMQKLDTWTPSNTSTLAVTPRIVDLIAPTQEDAWSLVDITAIVLDVRSSTIYLDVDGIDIQVKIKPMVRYRATRLKEGDTVRIRGLLDLKNDVPAIYPRTAEEITILKSATAKISTNTPSTHDSLPSWTPFGAAGATIALSQGYKKIKEKREKMVMARAVAKVGEPRLAQTLPTSTKLDNVPDAYK